MPNTLLDAIIHENIKTDEVFPHPGLLWWEWIFIIFGVGAFITLLYFLLKIRKPSVAASVSAIEVFDSKINKLETELLKPAEFAVTLSTLIREYLFQSSDLKTLFQTNEEINTTNLQALNTSEETKQDLLEFLNSLDALKYGKATSEEISKETVLKSAHALIHKVEWESTQSETIPAE